MTNRMICATPWEVKALLPEQLKTFWRPVTPQLPGDVVRAENVDGVWRFYGGLCGDKHYLDENRRCPFGQPGDVLAIKETWRASLGKAHDRPAIYVRYKASPDIVSILLFEDDNLPDIRKRQATWRSPATMPRWAVRDGFVRPITDVRVVRVQRANKDDAKAAGIVLRPTELFPRINTEDKRLQEFARVWQARYGTWSENPPAWGITIGGNDRCTMN